MNAAIYLRTSTTDQEPELQRRECEEFAASRGYHVVGVYHEQISGWKDVRRPEYEKVKDLAFKGKIKAVIVWRLDRWARNRETIMRDSLMLKTFGCKLHAVKQQWVETVNVPGPLGDALKEFVLGIEAARAQMESDEKSERTKLAVRKDENGVTVSYNGNKWGRPGVNERTIREVVEARNLGMTYEQISKSVFYWDKSRNKKFVSKGLVHKILVRHTQGKPS